jgi:hypothetical protein
LFNAEQSNYREDWMFAARSYKFRLIVTYLMLLPVWNSTHLEGKSSAHDSLIIRVAGPTEKETTTCSHSGGSQRSIACNNEDSTQLPTELSGLGQRGGLISRTREQTLQILQSDNICAAWFKEADPDAVEVFGSLHYQLYESGPSDIYILRNNFGEILFKYPWGARSRENAGRDSTIEINSNGPFFVRKSRLTVGDPVIGIVPSFGLEPIIIGPYTGTTTEARIAIMLHELGHIIGRLPKDDDSLDGRSSQNTAEVLRYCKKEIRQAARKYAHGD